MEDVPELAVAALAGIAEAAPAEVCGGRRACVVLRLAMPAVAAAPAGSRRMRLCGCVCCESVCACV